MSALIAALAGKMMRAERALQAAQFEALALAALPGDDAAYVAGYIAASLRKLRCAGDHLIDICENLGLPTTGIPQLPEGE